MKWGGRGGERVVSERCVSCHICVVYIYISAGKCYDYVPMVFCVAFGANVDNPVIIALQTIQSCRVVAIFPGNLFNIHRNQQEPPPPPFIATSTCK